MSPNRRVTTLTALLQRIAVRHPAAALASSFGAEELDDQTHEASTELRKREGCF
jgi:hypothetical protein